MPLLFDGANDDAYDDDVNVDDYNRVSQLMESLKCCDTYLGLQIVAVGL